MCQIFRGVGERVLPADSAENLQDPAMSKIEGGHQPTNLDSSSTQVRESAKEATMEGDSIDDTGTSNGGQRRAFDRPAQSLPSSSEDPATRSDTAHQERNHFEQTDKSEPAPATVIEGQIETTRGGEGHTEGDGVAQISKNQLKRLKRQRIWEERKEDRKRLRKDKKHERAARKRAEREEKVAEAKAAGLDPEKAIKDSVVKPNKYKPNPVPVAFILDCDFEEYMRDPEIVSLSSQVVRSYSQNRCCKYQAHLFVSSFKGRLKTRFETVLTNNHKKWKGVHIIEDDFKEAARRASELMVGPSGGEMIEPLREKEGCEKGVGSERDATDSSPVPEPEPDNVDKSIVYLTSESPYTLEKLEPYTSYVIGGLVDRNREKGLCYRRAREMKVRTAKLPIGEYMAMQSRYVLTTNQVVEIMAKWLECGDWAEAFLTIIPKRKGGVLKEQQNSEMQESEPGLDDDRPVSGEEDSVGFEDTTLDNAEAGPSTVPAASTAD